MDAQKHQEVIRLQEAREKQVLAEVSVALGVFLLRVACRHDRERCYYPKDKPQSESSHIHDAFLLTWLADIEEIDSKVQAALLTRVYFLAQVNVECVLSGSLHRVHGARRDYNWPRIRFQRQLHFGAISEWRRVL
jgi:hypothetical protein